MPLDSQKASENRDRLDAPHQQPIMIQISKATRISGLSRTEIYRRIARGQLEAKKAGSRTLITFASLERHLASLPPASINVGL